MVNVLPEWSGQQSILISTIYPLKESYLRFKESTGNIVDSQRAEMLQQANALDERGFSSLRRLMAAERALLHATHDL